MNARSVRPLPILRLIDPVWPPLLLAACCLVLAFAVSPFLWLDGLAILGCGVLVLDTAARYRQYRVLRMALRQANGVTGRARRLFRRARGTWCTRRAALAAAHAEGFGREARALVCRWGYRPWHIFPDGTFTRRSPFLRFAFWRSVFGLEPRGPGHPG